MIKKASCLLLFFFFSFILFPLFAQEDSINNTLKLDIESASLVELAIMCRELGLSESGRKEDLQKRLFAHYKIESKTEKENEKKDSIILIESARKSEYFSLESVNEDYLRLSGDVRLTFVEDENTHIISADDFLYNKSTDTIYARGNVVYIKESESNFERFTGEVLRLNIETWEALFVAGSSERGKKTGDNIYRFTAEKIIKTDEEVTVFEDAYIENAESETAYWSLSASKIWFMPGSDWAIKNATLRVGYVPVFYIPFFYYPGDKIFFHPVFGVRPREGSFLQTTTYLIGESKAEVGEDSSIIKILEESSDRELRREGLFLVKSKEKKKESDKSLALLFDIYSKLGGYAGIEADFPKSGIFGATKLSGGLGFSRTLFSTVDGKWTPFKDSYSLESEWNSSNLFSFSVPFRYRLNASGSFVFPKATVTWAFPSYSDIYVNQDFLNRSEKIDWFNLVKSGAASLEESKEIGTLSSYNLRIAVNNLRFSNTVLSPFLDSFSVDTFSSHLNFNTKFNTSLSFEAPARTFFYPSNLQLINLALTFSG